MSQSGQLRLSGDVTGGEPTKIGHGAATDGRDDSDSAGSGRTVGTDGFAVVDVLRRHRGTTPASVHMTHPTGP